MAAERDTNGNRDVRPAHLAPRAPAEENRADASGPMTARRIGALCWAACVAATLGTLILLVLHLGVSSRAGGQDIGGYAGLGLAVAGLAFATGGAAGTGPGSRNPHRPSFFLPRAEPGLRGLPRQRARRAGVGAPG